MWSEAIKILKGEYAVRAIKEHKMDQAIIFCRTKIDCDNLEQYFMQQGGGKFVPLISHFTDYYPHVDKARVCAQSLKQRAYCNLSVSVQYFSMDKPWDKHENFFHRAIIVSNMNLDHRTLMP